MLTADILRELEPREWQRKALEAWRIQHRGIVRVVTGGGKTVFAMMCIGEFLSNPEHCRVVIIVPTTALLDQWFVGLVEDMGLDPSDIGTYSGQEKTPTPKLVNLLVINTARELAITLSQGYRSFLIVDECHRAGSPVNARALAGQYAATLGLSATPDRQYDLGFQEYIAPVLGEVVFEYNYDDALRDGVITPFELINVRVDLLPSETERFNEFSRRLAVAVRKSGDTAQPTERIKRLLQQRASVANSAKMRIPVTVKLVEEHRNKRLLIFHERIDAADTILDLLLRRGHRATIYHTKIGPSLRRENLRLYRKGVFDILVTCRALDEGLNVPETEVAIVASATASKRQRIQRLGRVLRPAKNKGSASVYTIYATDQEERRLLLEARTYREIVTVSWQKGGIRGNG